MDINSMLNPMDKHMEKATKGEKQASTTPSNGHSHFHHGPLPSVNHLLCLANPPATLEAALPARTLQSSNSAGTNLQLGDIETRATYQVVERSYHDLYYPMAYTPRSTTSIKRYHSNERYSTEQVHWIRYHKTDLKWNWKDIAGRFVIVFSTERPDASEGGLTSSFYRDNDVPRIDRHGNFLYDATTNKILTLDMKVRTKDEGECSDEKCPWSFVERYPWAALKYDWVSPAHKLQAKNIIADIKRRRHYTRKQQYILAFRRLEKKRALELAN
ncbi:uncharacterized protein LY89DRAFT_766512 [Mollisia scopiformis]|uniref:Uncharacterized protein n=1 Tax=Mollisia scopiformis TaxID=149040 RepID=A0A132B5S1_MOLSC|nr:uncharacterized protein LY89DRAFT_766512 [Mollisia scopiformis]KUJ07339.1 hypothetical protein LY89DRAFT_766512 [Mollisia scopiformis]